MQPPFPAPVTEWHNDTYDAINPTRPELSQAGKVIVVTGAGQGIGREIVDAFAQAGATTFHILGRTQITLEETKNIVEKKYPNTKVTVHVADITEKDLVDKAAKAIGTWDVLAANAGYLSTPALITENPEDWWKSFEINVKGSLNLATAFLPNKKAGGTIIGFSTGAALLPATDPILARTSAYSTSKLALSRFYEFISAENPDLSVFVIHPGVVETAMYKKSEMDLSAIQDTIQLPAHFTVWLSSPEAKILNGRFLFVNWDVPQLLKKGERLESDPFYLNTGLGGWPFTY